MNTDYRNIIIVDLWIQWKIEMHLYMVAYIDGRRNEATVINATYVYTCYLFKSLVLSLNYISITRYVIFSVLLCLFSCTG